MVSLGATVTVQRVAMCFVTVTAFLALIGIVMQVRNLDKKEGNPVDCTSCGVELDKQIPVISAILKLISGREFPMFGLCSKCKVTFDSNALQRYGDYCLVWKEHFEVLNSFEVFLPIINFTCDCAPLFKNDHIHPPKELLSVLPCLNVLPNAVQAVKSSSDLSLEALELCNNMADNFNFSHLLDPDKATVSFAVNNFRLKFGALINENHDVKLMTTRLSHMRPENIHIGCDVDEAYRQTCRCYQNENVRRLIYFGLKGLLPCFVNEIFKHQNQKMLRKAAFCYPKKKVQVFSGLDAMF